LIRGLEKLAEELASKSDLRGVVANLHDSLRKGRRPKRSMRFAELPRLQTRANDEAGFIFSVRLQKKDCNEG